MVSCWVYSLALETAETHKDHEPFPTGHPGVTDSLWGNGNIALMRLQFKESRRNIVGNTLEVRNYSWILYNYCIWSDI